MNHDFQRLLSKEVLESPLVLAYENSSPPEGWNTPMEAKLVHLFHHLMALRFLYYNYRYSTRKEHVFDMKVDVTRRMIQEYGFEQYGWLSV